MSLSLYRPSTDLFRPFFDEFFFNPSSPLRPQASRTDAVRLPECDVLESEQELRFAIDLPGLRPEDVEISVEDNLLTIKGERRDIVEKEEGEDANGRRWHIRERSAERFSRTFRLPREIEQDRIAATFENGVLHLIAPKSEKARPRRIEIR